MELALLNEINRKADAMSQNLDTLNAAVAKLTTDLKTTLAAKDKQISDLAAEKAALQAQLSAVDGPSAIDAVTTAVNAADQLALNG